MFYFLWKHICYYLRHELSDQRADKDRWRQSICGLVRDLGSGRCCQSGGGCCPNGAGQFSNVQWLRGIGEYKIDWGPGLRIYLAKDGLKLILLIGGGTKKRQQKDIDQALVLWDDYKRRKASGGQGN